MKLMRAPLLAAAFLAGLMLPALAETPANNTVYEIFVRSFADGTPDAKSNGDLKGILDKLDYLNDGDAKTGKDLGVGILWLMPIFPAKAYHGYDVTDFRNVNPDFGTLADFKALTDEAHKRGVRIILDIPFNHTSVEHPWFKTAVEDKNSKERKFYRIEADAGPARNGKWHKIVSSSGEKLRYFSSFTGDMADLDFNNKEVQDEVKEIARFWLAQGADGFRLDAAKHFFENDNGDLTNNDILKHGDWWLAFSKAVYTAKPEAILTGEVLGDRGLLNRFTFGLDGLIDEPFMIATRDQIQQPRDNYLNGNKGTILAAQDLNRKGFDAMNLPTPAPFKDQPFEFFPYVAGHDVNPRLATFLEGKQDADGLYRLATYLLLTEPGYPVIYQGDEIKQKGKRQGAPVFDITLREPFPWFKSGSGAQQTKWVTPVFDKPNDGVSQEEQADRDDSMLSLVRALVQLRAKVPALGGEYGKILSDSGGWMVSERVRGNDKVLVLINQNDKGLDYNFSQSFFAEYIKSKLLFWSDGAQKKFLDQSANPTSIEASVFVPARGLVVL